jgi:hypothetical protein
MVTEIRIYFEGASELREGFRSFFGEIKTADGRGPKLIAGGGREQAIADFRKSFKSHAAALNLLLIDSEGPDTGRLFETICQPQQIPENARGKVFWMVECMESWFLADVEALGRYYYLDLAEALRGNPDVEEIPKRDVLARLKAATNGRYHKTKDAPHLLKRILPERVKQAAPNCRRLFNRFLSDSYRSPKL